MLRAGSEHLFVYNIVLSLLFVLNESANIFSGIPILNQINSNDSSIFGIPRISLQRFIGDVSLENIAEYEAGVKTGDKDLNITQLIEKYGYHVETHETETEDGYIIVTFRIRGDGPPAFFAHGLSGDADYWVSTGPDISLAYMLADKGYDVWLGNARGTKHCHKHVNLTIDDDKFWDFSWDEIGRYDITAVIDYILKVTGRDQVIYLGHSQGSTVFFVMASERPEYNKKVSYAVLFGVAAWISHSTSLIVRQFAPQVQEYNPFVKIVFGRNPETKGTRSYALKKAFCMGGLIQNLFCYNVASLIGGYDNKQINFKGLASQCTHSAGAFSVKQLEHYGQIFVSEKFRKFDYKKENMKRYGLESPPEYPVHKITVPLAIYQAKNDIVINEKDVQILIDHLTTNVTYHVVPYESFTHIDYIYAKDARTLLYNDVLDLMGSYKTN